jgi:hypothetical protein
MINNIANFPEILNYILGALCCLLVFALAYAYLKPHKLHHSRPLSTFALKSSYLLYLAITLIIIYFAALSRTGLNNIFAGIEFFILLIVIFVPTVAIFARKITHFSDHRVRFNIIFTIVNLIMAFTILIMYFL